MVGGIATYDADILNLQLAIGGRVLRKAKRDKPEDVVTKLRQFEVLVGQGMARVRGRAS